MEDKIEIISFPIITKRPEGLSQEEYKELLKAQKKHLKNRLKGISVWKSLGAGGGTYIKEQGPLRNIRINPNPIENE